LSLLTLEDVALSPPEYLCLKMGGIMSHFNVLLIVRGVTRLSINMQGKVSETGHLKKGELSPEGATAPDQLRHCFPFSALCLGFCVATLQHELVHLPCNMIFLPA